eukprot:2667878-Pleurochrysis_carterae.AAC.2
MTHRIQFSGGGRGYACAARLLVQEEPLQLRVQPVEHARGARRHVPLERPKRRAGVNPHLRRQAERNGNAVRTQTQKAIPSERRTEHGWRQARARL